MARHIYIKTSFLCALFFFVCKAFSQNIDYSQSNTNRIYLNPAFAGIETCFRAYTSYRLTYTNIYGGYTTNYVSADMFNRNVDGGIGVSFIHDIQESNFYTTGFSGMYSKDYRLKQGLIFRPAILMGVIQSRFTPSEEVFSDMLHPVYGYIETLSDSQIGYSKNYFNSEFGMLLYNKLFYAGLTIKHMNHVFAFNRNNFSTFLPQFSIHGGAEFSANQGFIQSTALLLYPHVNVTVSRESTYMLFSMMAKKNQLQIGGGYRQNFPVSNESFLFFVGFVEKKYKFAYNCDVAIKSKVGGVFKAHEFSLSYHFDCGTHRRIGAGNAPGY